MNYHVDVDLRSEAGRERFLQELSWIFMLLPLLTPKGIWRVTVEKLPEPESEKRS